MDVTYERRLTPFIEERDSFAVRNANDVMKMRIPEYDYKRHMMVAQMLRT